MAVTNLTSCEHTSTLLSSPNHTQLLIWGVANELREAVSVVSTAGFKTNGLMITSMVSCKSSNAYLGGDGHGQN